MLRLNVKTNCALGGNYTKHVYTGKTVWKEIAMHSSRLQSEYTLFTVATVVVNEMLG